MFEEEAEEYAVYTRIKDKNTYINFPDESISKVQDFEGNYIDISERIIRTFKDASELGYNKANEWHFPSKGEFPKDNDEKLCFCGKGKVVARYNSKYSCWETYFNNFETIIPSSVIIAWKEIILPKEIG